MITSTTNDIAGLHLGDQAEDEAEKEKYKEQPGLSMKQEELLAKVRKEEEESERKNISLIVVGGSRDIARGARRVLIIQVMSTRANQP